MVRANWLLAVGPLLGVVAVMVTATPRPAAPGPESAPHVSVVRPTAPRRPPAPQPPLACFATKGCPGVKAEICFAGPAARAPTSQCPTISSRYKYAAP